MKVIYTNFTFYIQQWEMRFRVHIEPLLPFPTSFNNLLGKGSASQRSLSLSSRKEHSRNHRMRVLTPSALLEACFFGGKQSLKLRQVPRIFLHLTTLHIGAKSSQYLSQ